MEEELDEIARGEISWKPIVRNFWKPFINLIDQKDNELKKSDIIEKKQNPYPEQIQAPLSDETPLQFITTKEVLSL